MLTTLAAWLHNLDPFAIQFPTGFVIDGLRWYGLAYLAGFIAGYLLLRRVATVGKSPMQVPELYDFVFVIAVGVLVGGRLGFVFFYEPSLLTHFESRLPFWGVLQINRGGMASHGGIIGMIAASLYYAWRHKKPWLHLMDLIAFGAPIGVFFGRVANFINGELVGRVCDPDMPLAVKFPQELREHIQDLTPEQWTGIAEAAGHVQDGRTYFDAGDYGVVIDRLIAAVQQGNQQVIAIIEPMLPARHPSQLYAAVLEGLIVLLAVAVVWTKPRKPGLVLGVCLLFYGSMRMISEVFRTPDEGIGFQALGLTRGQWLSVPVIVLAIGIIVYAVTRKHAEAMGGWLRGATSDAPTNDHAA